MFDAKPPSAAAGDAVVTVRLGHIEAQDPPHLGDDLTVSVLPTLITTATTTASHVSSLMIGGVRAGDVGTSDQFIRSGDPNAKVEKDQPRDIKRRNATVDLAIGGWAAEAFPELDTAAARLGVLSGELTSNKMGLRTSIGERGLFSEVSKEASQARGALTIEGFDMNLGAILPVDVLALPFGITLEMVRELQIPLPDELQGDVNRFAAVLDRLAVVEEGMGMLDEARGRLAAHLAGMPGIDDALDAIDTAQGLLAAAQQDLAAAIATLTDAEAALAAAQAVLAAAQAELAAAQAVLTAAQQDVASIGSEIAAVEAELAELQENPAELLLNAGAIAAKTAERAALLQDLATAQAAEAAAQDEVNDAQAAVTAAQTEEGAARTARDAARGAKNAAQNAVDEARARLATAEAAYDALVDTKAAADDQLAILKSDVRAMKMRLAAMFLELQPLLEGLRDLAGLHQALLEQLEATPIIKVGAMHLIADATVNADGPSTEAVCTVSGIEVLGRPVPTGTCEDLQAVADELTRKINGLLALLSGKAVEGVILETPMATRHVSDKADAKGMRKASVEFRPFKVVLPAVRVDLVAGEVHARLGEILDWVLSDPDLQTMPEFVGNPSVPLELLQSVPGAGGQVRAQGGDVRAMGPAEPVERMLEDLEEDDDETPPAGLPSQWTGEVEAELAGVKSESSYRAATTGGPGGSGSGGGPVGGGQNPGSGSGSGDGDGDGANGGRPDLGEGGVGSGEHSDAIGGDVPAVGVGLPHTGGGASAALAGLALLAGSVVLRRRRVA